jgi:polyisoprenoid-binding protein YceI
MKILFLFALISLSAWGQEKLSWKEENFESALKAQTQFRFIGKSTKLGFITTSFEGVAREGEITFQKSAKTLTQVELKLVANKIDTNSDARNEKMWEKCLRAEKYPTIKVTITDPIDLDKTEQAIAGMMTVAETTIGVPLMLTKKSDRVFAGKGQFSLKAAGIPDPSIAIASVADKMEIHFEVTLP